MSGVANTVVIERLVLDGLDLEPGGAERVRAQVEAELARMLNGQELVGVDIPQVTVPDLSNRAIRSERGLAASLARRIGAACAASSGRAAER